MHHPLLKYQNAPAVKSLTSSPHIWFLSYYLWQDPEVIIFHLLLPSAFCFLGTKHGKLAAKGYHFLTIMPQQPLATGRNLHIGNLAQAQQSSQEYVKYFCGTKA